MAQKKITQLTATTTADGTDLATTVVDVATTPANRKITIANLLKQIFLAAGTKLSFTTIADGEFLKRVGTNITSAAAAPADATFITQTASADLTNEQAMGLLATGMVKNTTTTGVLSIGAPATDYVAPGTITTSGLTQNTARLLGRTTASAGAIEEISAGTGITLTGGTISSTGGASTVPSTVQGDILYASGTDTLAALAKDTNATRYLSNTGTTNNPAWAQVAISTGVSGLGTGVATFLATPSSANLAAAVTDETGSGALTFATSPVFTTDITLPNSAAPTTGAVAKVAFDTDAWAASRGAIQVHDGTANTFVVATQATDVPTNGQVPTWNTGGTITWETPAAGGSPGGLTTQIQFNNSGSFGGDPDLTWVSNTMTFGGSGGLAPEIAMITLFGIGANVAGSNFSGIGFCRDSGMWWCDSSSYLAGTRRVGIYKSTNAGFINLTTGTFDTLGWWLQQGDIRCTADFPKTTATLANITGVTCPIVPDGAGGYSNNGFSGVWEFEFEAAVDADVTGGYKFAVVHSGATTSILYHIQFTAEGTPATIDLLSRQTASGGSAGTAGATAGRVRIAGTITPTNAGNLTVQFAQNTASGTSTVKADGCFFRVKPIPR